MAFKLGSDNLSAFKVGSSNVSKIYKGTNIVFEAIIATIPGQVTNFTASVWMENDPQYPDAIELLWDAPDNGGSAITGYDIQYISNQDINMDIQNWTNIDNVTFPSLIWYGGGSLTRYYFRIRAKNNIGDGPWSSIIPPQSYDGGIQFPKGGCTDTSAFNYDPTATRSNGNCVPVIYGCTDPGAMNYNGSANTDDGSCYYDMWGCTDSNANNYDSTATDDDGSCTYDVYGCMDLSACNYDPSATVDVGCAYDGTFDNGCTGNCYERQFLIYYGCGAGYESIFEYDSSCSSTCPQGCTDPNATNYDPNAVIDDGSCTYE